MADDNAAPTTEAGEQKRELSFSLLASEMFGSDFHGEVPKDEPEKAAADEGGEGEPDEPAEAPAEGDAEPEKPEGESEADEVVVSSLQELIEQNEWDPEWVNSLKVPVKVDGKTAEATLKDLVDGYQMRQAAEHRLEEAKAKTKTVNEELAAKSQELQAQFVAAAELIKGVESRLTDDVASINWKQLRDSDPAEYAAKKAEVAERRADIDEMKRKAVEGWQKTQETQTKELAENFKQHLAAEHAALLEKIPEWRDSEKAKAEKAELLNHLIERGFSREEAMGASDHRLLLMARDAMLLRKMKASGDVARKKMAKVPKVMKPGAPKPSDQQARERVSKLEARARQTGSLDDAFALLQAKRSGG